MAGLLGEDWDDPKTQMNLMLAAGLLGGRGNFAQVLGGAIPGAMQARNQAQAAIGQRQMQEMQRKLIESQIGENAAQSQQRLAAIEEAKRKAEQLRAAQAYLSSLGSPVMQAPPGQVGPVHGAQMVPREFNISEFMASSGDLDSAKKFAETQNLLKPKPEKPVANNKLEIFEAWQRETDPARKAELFKAWTTVRDPTPNVTYLQTDKGWAPANTRAPGIGAPLADLVRRDPSKASREVANLRKEYEGRTEVKKFREAIPIIESARKAPQTSQGDLQLIYAAGKVLDPESVVREGEMQLVVKSGSPEERVLGFMSYLVGGGRMTPTARQNLIKSLEGRVVEYQRDYDVVSDEYSRMATESGFDPKNIVVNRTTLGRGEQDEKKARLNEMRKARGLEPL